MSKEKEANLPQRGERALIISVNVASLTRHTSIYRSRYTRNWIENKNSEKETYTNGIIVIIIIQISRKLVSQKELNFHRYINNFLFAEITCGKKSFLLHTDAFNEVFNATVAFRWKHEVLANHSSNVTLRLLFTYLFCWSITCAGTQFPVCDIQQNLHNLKTKTKLTRKDSDKQFNTLVSKFGHKQHD